MTGLKIGLKKIYHKKRKKDALKIRSFRVSFFTSQARFELTTYSLGNIKEEAVQTVGDDGVSQSVVAKTGVATVRNVLVPNPVVLAPYRTFAEVEQPESEFIFRMQKVLLVRCLKQMVLNAMSNIKTHLHEALSPEIEVGKIVIIL